MREFFIWSENKVPLLETYIQLQIISPRSIYYPVQVSLMWFINLSYHIYVNSFEYIYMYFLVMVLVQGNKVIAVKS